MKGLKKKLVLCVATAFAAFFAFMFPFGFVPVLAEENENTANYEAVLGEVENEEEIATSQAPRNDSEGGDSILADDDSSGMTEESEGEGSIIPETVDSEWFKEKIVPYLLEFATAAAGAIFSFIWVLKKYNLKLGDLINACNVLRKANADSEETKADVAKQNAFIQEWTSAQNEFIKSVMGEQSEEMKKWQETQTAAMLEGLKQIREEVKDRIEDACETVHKILDVEEIAYQNNPAMVSQGTTAKIEEVIHNGTEKKDEPDNEG